MEFIASVEEDPKPPIHFAPLPDLVHSHVWEQTPVRPPADPDAAGRLAYHDDHKATTNFGRAQQASNLIQIILREHGYRRAESLNDGWSLFWSAGALCTEEELEWLQHPWQKVNKFPASLALTSKTAMWTHFARMQLAHGSEAYGFVPDTFVLPEALHSFEHRLRATLEGARDTEAAAAAASQDAAAAREAALTWILKPSDTIASSKGSGIFLHRATLQWTSAYGETALSDEVRQHEGVAGASLHPPLLLWRGLKSDLRLYVLVTSFDPLVAYLHHEGLARFATEPYSLDAQRLTDRCAHLTNYSLNKHSKKYGGKGEGGAGAPSAAMASAGAEPPPGTVGVDHDASGFKWALGAANAPQPQPPVIERAAAHHGRRACCSASDSLERRGVVCGASRARRAGGR